MSSGRSGRRVAQDIGWGRTGWLDLEFVSSSFPGWIAFGLILLCVALHFRALTLLLPGISEVPHLSTLCCALPDLGCETMLMLETTISHT